MYTYPAFHISLWPFIAHILISKPLSDSFSAIWICASVPRRDYICCHAHALWGYVLFFKNCFTRVNRRLVNSFSYSNRIFWSRENVIMEFKNKQTRTRRFRLYISYKHWELWHQWFWIGWGSGFKNKTWNKTVDDDSRQWACK